MDKHLAALLLALSALWIHGCTREPVGNMDQTAHSGDYATPDWRQ